MKISHYSVVAALTVACNQIFLVDAATTVVNLNGYAGVATKIAGSTGSIHASQTVLGGGIPESIAVNPNTGDIFVQHSSNGYDDTGIYKIDPTNGLTSTVCASTSFVVNDRGADLIYDENTGLLLTMDDRMDRVATVDPNVGCNSIGTWTSFNFNGATFGGQISSGVNSDVPSGTLVFTSDLGRTGIASAAQGQAVVHNINATDVLSPADDMCIQPKGDWVHVRDLGGTVDKYSPTSPYNILGGEAGVNWRDEYAAENLSVEFGTRATCCPGTVGFVYMSTSVFSNAILQITEDVQQATAIVRLDDGYLHDLTIGPSSASNGNSIFFTTKAFSGENEVWELTTPECVTNSTITGDPHIQTWSRTKYDFHGVCDLVLLQNPDFLQGIGMDIHVRTKQLKQFSYVSSAVLRIGDDSLEVMGDIHENLYWINKQANGNLDVGIHGYNISYRKVNSKQHEFVVDLGGGTSIVMRTFKKFVRVSINGGTKKQFGNSLGLLGSYGSGKMIARDGSTIVEDTNAFGQEWQVLPSDGMLFHNVDGPQAPAKCEIPVASNLRRRLAESNVNEEDAEIACSRVNPEDFDMCLFDVMATGDMEVVGAY